MKKTYVLDTNILLENPNSLFAFDKNDVVLPYKVIEELDKHKTSQGLKGLYARDSARIIISIVEGTNYPVSKGIKIKTGGKLFLLNSDDIQAKGVGELTNSDDHILDIAVRLSQTKRHKIILVSNDILIKIKAKSHGLETQSYNSQQNINSVDDLYSGYHVVRSNVLMSKIYENHKEERVHPEMPKELKDVHLLPNDFVQVAKPRATRATTKPYPLLRYKSDQELHYVHEKKAYGIQPVNIEQTMAMELLMDPDVPLVTLTGISGCGKTLITLAAALEQVINRKTYTNVLVMRPVHAVGKEIGYLPGTKEEKLEPWIAPIKDNLKVILSNGKKNKKDADNELDYLYQRGYIDIEAMTYIRGRSINNTFILIDEAQNISAHEMKALLTRVGMGTKIVLTGDIEQTDRNDVDSISNGLSVVIEKFKQFELAGHVSMVEGVRSELSELAAKLL